jgi:hypothetical protein
MATDWYRNKIIEVRGKKRAHCGDAKYAFSDIAGSWACLMGIELN